VVGEDAVDAGGEEGAGFGLGVAEGGRVCALAQRGGEEVVFGAEGPDVDEESGGVGAGNEVGGGVEFALGDGNDEGLVCADGVGVGGDVAEAGVGEEVGDGAGVAVAAEVVGEFVGADELDEADAGEGAEAAEVFGLEALDEDGCVGRVGVVLVKQADEGVLHGGDAEAGGDFGGIGGMLGLGVDADGSAEPGGVAVGEGDDLVERGDFVFSVVGGGGWA
jgi:hypothetical protein